MKFRILTTCAALLLAAATAGAATGPSIDWDPAFTWETNPAATYANSPPGSEFRAVGIVSGFDAPFGFLNASDPTREYTFYLKGLISLGTVTYGPPATEIYETGYVGGTFELYEDLTPDASFDQFPPNAGVPADFIDGTLLLSGNFTSFVVQSNNFTAFQTGNIEGNLNWTGGTLLGLTTGCTGLFTGGSTWNASVGIPGYIYRHDGKIDLQCPTNTRTSTWGTIKSLYR